MRIDPEPAYHFDADPDPAYYVDADPDPTVQFDADPDPQHWPATCDFLVYLDFQY
jgi:hypothetical protein